MSRSTWVVVNEFSEELAQLERNASAVARVNILQLKRNESAVRARQQGMTWRLGRCNSG